MNDPIDQLKEWWDNAEVPTAHTLPREGDRIIFRYNSEWYEVAAAADDAEECDLFAGMRILTRSPRPEWHDSVAVMARSANAPEGHREPFIRSEASPDVWIGEGGYGYSGDLRDVTPLVEAKVTDEMVLRALNTSTGLYRMHLTSFTRDDIEDMRFTLTSALGIEDE